MTTEKYSHLEIPFSESDQASVFHAHLQNILLDLLSVIETKDYLKGEQTIHKLDHVLFDVYLEYQKLQKQHFETTKSMQSMLTECSDLMNECRVDREALVKVTEDRQQILEKLKKSTDTSLELVRQNEKLYQEMKQMQELNQLLVSKNQVLEEQLKAQEITSKGYDHVINISKEFEKISENNTSLQADILEVLKTTQMYGNASEPLQVMCLGFQQKPQIRDELWESVQSKHANKFQDVKKTKDNFFNFGYVDALMLIASSAK